MIIAVALPPEAVAALLGAAVGSVGSWGLAVVRDWSQARRDRQVAAMLVLTELTAIGAATTALRRSGVVSPPFPQLERRMWESYGAALLHGGDLKRAGEISQAYTGAADLAAICQELGRDFTQGEDAAICDAVSTAVLNGSREVMRLAGLPEEEIKRRRDAIEKLYRGEQT